MEFAIEIYASEYGKTMEINRGENSDH